MTHLEIIKDLKSKKYHPVYCLHGDEPYFIDQVSQFIENSVLNETEKAFNQTIFYGKEADVTAVLDQARRYPMMSDYQVVIIKEAQEMKTLADLQPYVEKPVPSTLLVICHKHKKLDQRSKFYKTLNTNALIFESTKIKDYQLPDWITHYLSVHHLKITSEGASLIAEYLGNELGKIANELDKLAINLVKGTTINAEIIESNIGISKDYNVFELQKALAQKDIVKANRIVSYFENNPKNTPLVVVNGTLYSFFSKLYMLHFIKQLPEKEIITKMGIREWGLKEYQSASKLYPLEKTQAIIGLLKSYDLRSKGINNDSADEAELLKEMVWKILHN